MRKSLFTIILLLMLTACSNSSSTQENSSNSIASENIEPLEESSSIDALSTEVVDNESIISDKELNKKSEELSLDDNANEDLDNRLGNISLNQDEARDYVEKITSSNINDILDRQAELREEEENLVFAIENSNLSITERVSNQNFDEDFIDELSMLVTNVYNLLAIEKESTRLAGEIFKYGEDDKVTDYALKRIDEREDEFSEIVTKLETELASLIDKEDHNSLEKEITALIDYIEQILEDYVYIYENQ